MLNSYNSLSQSPTLYKASIDGLLLQLIVLRINKINFYRPVHYDMQIPRALQLEF